MMPRLASALLVMSLATTLNAQRGGGSAAEVEAKYAKREVRIAMRDGTELFTAIYTPRDTTKTYPIMLMRTPYGVGPYGANAYPASLGPWRAFQDDGFIFVNQDVRGRYMSDGYYQFMTPHIDVKKSNKDVDESSDTYDTIDWLIKNIPRNNGRVGTWGNSAPGFLVAAGLPDAHPAHSEASRRTGRTGRRGTLAQSTGQCGPRLAPLARRTHPGRRSPCQRQCGRDRLERARRRPRRTRRQVVRRSQ